MRTCSKWPWEGVFNGAVVGGGSLNAVTGEAVRLEGVEPVAQFTEGVVVGAELLGVFGDGLGGEVGDEDGGGEGVFVNVNTGGGGEPAAGEGFDVFLTDG